MSDKQQQSDLSDSEKVSRAASLYTHINDVLDAEGQIQGFVHYHLGFGYATEKLADKLEGLGVDKSWHVLDVCCGWGVPTRYVAGRLGCRMTGVDITQRSIDFAKKVTAGTELESLIEYKQGSALDLPIEDGSVDLIWSQDGLCHVPNRPRVLSECFRVLRPGGYLVFTDWMRGEFITQPEYDAFIEAWSFAGVEDPESYPKLLKEAGFEIVSDEKVGREYAVAGDTHAIENGLASLVQRAGGRDSAKIAQYVEAYGKDAHIAALEREKMDIHFAQGKMELGRYVCRKPA
jgi:ubiquinone/menaquinone biosynthesis C-methylase UbiE